MKIFGKDRTKLEPDEDTGEAEYPLVFKRPA